MTCRLTFLGAARTVTGSKTLVETGAARILVDCGMFQGWKGLRERNWSEPAFDPAGLDAVILTHAHLDHAGYLPRLCGLGFRGPIYCTPGTRDLLSVLLPDSGYLQEEAARHANRWRYSKHDPALPLYTRADAEACLPQLRPVGFHETFEPAPGKGVMSRFTRAGHILGSACLTLTTSAGRVTFSGDVGRPHDPIMRPPEPLPVTDTLVVESTYGDRRHPPEVIADVLAGIVRKTTERGGTLLVPAFAVGRAQHLLHLLAQLKRAGRIPDLPVFLDSPMAITATKIFYGHAGDHRLSEADCRAMDQLTTFTPTPDESRAIDLSTAPKIVISASGMATGGRILHHLRRFLPEASNTVLIVGYQAAGTRGRSLIDGADEIKMFGGYVPVKAEVVQVLGLSAHADYAELLDWLRAGDLQPKRVFVNHGEPSPADALRRRLKDTFAWDVQVPDDKSTWELD